MFDWIGDALSWVGDKFSDVGTAISEAVWDVMLEWLFNTIYGAVAEFFGMMNGMGADIFSQSWVSAFLQLFSLFGWTLFAAGLVVAVFDTAIEYQTGRANIQSTCLNVLKGFMAVSLFTKVPVELYKFCITLQTTFSGDLIGSFIGATRGDLGTTAEVVLKNMGGYSGLLGLLTMKQTGSAVTSYGVISGRGQSLYSALTMQPEQQLEEDLEEDFEMKIGGLSL